jgi:predicted metalloprotease with PDZ domain
MRAKVALLAFLVFHSIVPARAQTPDIQYTVTITNPISHLYDVAIDIHGLRTTTVDVAMPAWEPGNYVIRDFAKNVQDFRAFALEAPLKWTQTDKQTWRISKAAADDVTVRYQVFSINLTDQLADISGPSLFMYVVGQKQRPAGVKYLAPKGWTVYTGLEPRADTYYAADYDVLADSPALLGDHFKVLEFKVANIPHRLVFSQFELSMVDAQVTNDVTQIVEAARLLFGGTLPYKDFTFLIRSQSPTGSTGVEHRNSAHIAVGESDFVNESSYQQFLTVVAHDLVHVWNGKRLHPAVLQPLDYTKETNTRLLWLMEGITNYYADVVLARADIISSQEFLDKMSLVVDRLQRAPGRLLMSAEESSWNTWTRSENAENNSIAYGDKGEILGLLLDLEIRARTKNAKGLEDVMRYLLANYADKALGLPEDGFLKAVQTVSGSDFQEFFQANVQSRKELDYDRYLKQAGLQISIARQPGTIYVGIEYERNDAGLPRIKRALPGSPAEKAKLDAGDVLVAMNNERLTYENFRIRLHSHKLGETIHLTLMRGERMLAADLTPIEYQQQTWTIAESPQPTPDQTKLLNSIVRLQK